MLKLELIHFPPNFEIYVPNNKIWEKLKNMTKKYLVYSTSMQRYIPFCLDPEKMREYFEQYYPKIINGKKYYILSHMISESKQNYCFIISEDGSDIDVC
jgi:hypothetical protein